MGAGFVSEDLILPIGDIANNYSPNPMVRRHGPGPEGKTCKTCRRMVAGPGEHQRTYWKCERRGISAGQGTDHRMKWPACRLYEEEAR